MTIKRILHWIFPVLWIILIFDLSTQSGSDSSALSHWLADRIASYVNSGYFHDFLRSGAHFCIHFILAVFVYAAAHADKFDAYFVTIYICIPIAFCDEFTQIFIPGRDFELSDIVLNIFGIMLALIICTAIAPKKAAPSLE